MTAIDIGTRQFTTKDAAKREVRRILHAAEIDAPLTGETGALVSALYQLHPRSDGRPDAFCVGINNFHGARTRGFHALWKGGTRTSWSYIPCLNPAAMEPSITRVMRAGIMLSQRATLREFFVGRAFHPCSSCGLPVALEAAHVHHKPPKFRDIADAFIGLIGLPRVQTAVLGDEFAEPVIRARWVQFHDAVANRVICCAQCNADDEH